MSNENSNVNPAPHIHGPMTKNRMMQYTFVAILATLIVSMVLWSSVTTPSGWNLGLTLAICTVISVGLQSQLTSSSAKQPMTAKLTLGQQQSSA